MSASRATPKTDAQWMKGYLTDSFADRFAGMTDHACRLEQDANLMLYAYNNAVAQCQEQMRQLKVAYETIDTMGGQIMILRLDADRYRWLRNFANFGRVDSMLDAEYNTLDSAVDAARQSPGPNDDRP